MPSPPTTGGPDARIACRPGPRFNGHMPKLTRQQRRAQERSAAKRARAALSTPGASSRPFLLRTKTLLAIATSIVTIGSAAYAFWPTLEVDSVPWDNSRGPFDAKFQFTNGGRVPIYQVHFRCTINTATAKDIVTEGNTVTAPVTGKRGQDITEIAAGVTVQRDCGGPQINFGPHPSNVKIDATFAWPVTGHLATVSRYFVSNTDSSGRSWMSTER
jgi:hypothetical protein